MSVTNSFIIVAEDCPTMTGIVPLSRQGRQTLARLQYDLLIAHPYEYDLDELNFIVHCLMEDKAPTAELRKAFLSAPQPCLRSSPLTRSYGWGVHYDWAGRIALYPSDGTAYRKLINDPSLKVIRAVRNRQASAKLAMDNPERPAFAFQSVA